MLHVVMGRSSKDLRYLEEYRYSLKNTIEHILKSKDPLSISHEGPKMRIQLKTANWSIPQRVQGKVFVLNSPMTQNSVRSEIERIRKEYSGMIIFLVDGKAPVAILARWPDPASIIVAGQGGSTSECMNFARRKIPYINGAWDYFGELKKYVGKIIEIEP